MRASVTWSIIARNSAAGRIGIIVATRFFAVGALVGGSVSEGYE